MGGGAVEASFDGRGEKPPVGRESGPGAGMRYTLDVREDLTQDAGRLLGHLAGRVADLAQPEVGHLWGQIPSRPQREPRRSEAYAKAN